MLSWGRILLLFEAYCFYLMYVSSRSNFDLNCCIWIVVLEMFYINVMEMFYVKVEADILFCFAT